MKDIVSMSRVELVAELLATPDEQYVAQASMIHANIDEVCEGGFQVAVVTRKLLVAREIMLRDLISAMRTEPILGSPSIVSDWLRLHFAGLEHVVFVLLFLDNRNHLIAVEDMFRGTLMESSVYPREILKAALKHNAASVIAAHNYPSGHAEPSDGDQRLTRKLTSALAMIEVKLVDHFIVAGTKVVSFAERGWI